MTSESIAMKEVKRTEVKRLYSVLNFKALQLHIRALTAIATM